MPEIVSNLNVSALSAPDLYIQIVNPPSFIRGVPTDVFGIVGTASWGPTNIPVHLGSGQDGAQAFGPISAASLTDPYDIATDLALAFGQASSQASIEGFAVRVTDGTDTAASYSYTGTAADTETATFGGTTTGGDLITLTITESALAGSPFALTYTTLASDTPDTIAVKFAALINANLALAAGSITATVATDVVTISYPAAATVTFTKTIGSGDITCTLASGSTTTAALTLTAKYTGIVGNSLTVTIAAGVAASTYTVTVQPPYGVPEVYPNLPATNFWANLYRAINTGVSGFRGPSQLLTASAPNPAVLGPSAGTETLSGGTDGRAGVVTATLLGNSSATPPTGLYALANQNPQVGVVWIVGSTDTNLVASLKAFAVSAGCSVLFPFPTGTSTSTALSSVSSSGIHDPSLAYVKDWIYFYDPINAVVRLVPPTAVIGGEIVTQQPQQSPTNEAVNLVVGTERNNAYTGNQPYSPSEVGQLTAAGIMFITNPIPAGAEFGIRNGNTTSLNPATQPFEYWRMTMYLARSFANSLGNYVGMLQSQHPNDPLRQSIKLELNDFLNGLEGLGQIDSYLVSCNFSSSPSAQPGNGMNTPSSIAQHFLYVLVQVTYLSSVQYFILSLQGGTTVVTVSSGAGA